MKWKLMLYILWFFPKKIAHKILYYLKLKKRLDYNNLIGLNEKIQYLIVNEYGKKEANLSDKYLVKEYIRELNIEDLNIPKTYFIVDEKKYDINAFPRKFVLKCNHGSGDIFICNDKNEFDFADAVKKLSKVKKKNYAKKI